MRKLGRLCQVAALVVLPLSIMLQLQSAIDLRTMLGILLAGVCLFYIGRLVEGYARG